MHKVIAALLLFTAAAAGQNITGSILGNIRDSSGAAVTSCEVTITNRDTNQSVRTKPNEIGYFEAPYLRPGVYQVRVSAFRI